MMRDTFPAPPAGRCPQQRAQLCRCLHRCLPCLDRYLPPPPPARAPGRRRPPGGARLPVGGAPRIAPYARTPGGETDALPASPATRPRDSFDSRGALAQQLKSPLAWHAPSSTTR